MKKHLLALALIAATGAANAAVMSDSFSNVEQTTEINQSGVLDLFDSTLGTLTSVRLILNGSMTTTIDLSHTSSGSASGRATGQVTLDFATTLACPVLILVWLAGQAKFATSAGSSSP